MAEVVGLAASICTLSGCIKKVGDIASDLKNYGDKLESLNKALAGVELSSRMIDRLVKKWETEVQVNASREEGSLAQRNVPHRLDGHMEHLLGKCSRHLMDLVRDLENDINRIQSALRRRQSFAGIIFWVFNITTTAVKLVLRKGRLNVLILEAERMEASLGVALTAFLCYQSNVRGVNQEVFAGDMRKRFDYQTTEFKRLHRRLSYRKSIIRYKETHRTTRSRQEGSFEPSSEKRAKNTRRIPSGPSEFSGENRRSNEPTTSSHQGQDATSGGAQVEDAEDSTASAVRPNNAYPQSSENVEQLLMTLNRDLEESVSHTTSPISDFSETITTSERSGPPSDTSNYTPPVSDSESEISYSDLTDQRGEIDEEEINVRPDSRIIVDIDTDLSKCFRSNPTGWKFCVKSLLLPSSGLATFVVQTPCQTDCEHISIQTKLAASFRNLIPSQTLDVSLRIIATDTTSSTTVQDQQFFTFRVVSSSNSNQLRTECFHEQLVRKWVARRSQLFIVAFQTPVEAGESSGELITVDDEAQREEQVGKAIAPSQHAEAVGSPGEPEIVGDEAQYEGKEGEESNKVFDTPVENHALGPFSSVPCFFCGTDALNPRWTGTGAAGFLIGRNRSLRITCERCQDSTWISAMAWGFSLPGAEWQLGG